jgi:hypothetical protein
VRKGGKSVSREKKKGSEGPGQQSQNKNVWECVLCTKRLARIVFPFFVPLFATPYLPAPAFSFSFNRPSSHASDACIIIVSCTYTHIWHRSIFFAAGRARFQPPSLDDSSTRLLHRNLISSNPHSLRRRFCPCFPFLWKHLTHTLPFPPTSPKTTRCPVACFDHFQTIHTNPAMQQGL